ncbi:hypothetical protein [Arthrobacter sp. 260]|uniref:hypothetical protein n=1 Tax=Arthrobacter sp. 260 TaxID=2735314 RepID=UPI001490E417|nr:hypothetical protein [Arthrobacter sp. 260]NOJ60096.1 hypothetical protein [Arthrobacter sp. 260]
MTVEQTESSPLPPGIAIAWALGRPASRGMKAELSPARIIDAAIRITDAAHAGRGLRASGLAPVETAKC